MAARTEAVLIIGADEGIGVATRRLVGELEVEVRIEPLVGNGLRALGERRWSATVLSLAAPGSGLEIAARIRTEESAGSLVLLTDAPSPRLAMEATSIGAAELLALPLIGDELVSALRAALGAPTGIPLPPYTGTDASEELVGTSPVLIEVYKTVGRIAASTATVLVTGESGTGKELVARAVHRGGQRSGRPFIAVNCAAIPEDLLESELFGHERGAFTGAVARKIGRWERAHGGTLFLDEIGDMSLVLQAKILRALQEKEIERLGGEDRIPVDVRIVAATHRNLPERIEAGEFREDLYYRLAVVRLELPALRNRSGDIGPLALRFTAEFARAYNRPIRALAAEAMAELATHDWPGNVRELRNAMERAVLACTGETLLAEHIVLDRHRGGDRRESGALAGYSPNLSMADVEALHLREVLALVGGHIGRASDILRMHRNTVSRKAREYGLTHE